MVENIQGSPIQPRITFIILSYILMVLGLHVFVLPKIEKIEDCFYGFLFGLIVYGVYYFVCASIFEKWDLKIMVVDVLWDAQRAHVRREREAAREESVPKGESSFLTDACYRASPLGLCSSRASSLALQHPQG